MLRCKMGVWYVWFTRLEEQPGRRPDGGGKVGDGVSRRTFAVSFGAEREDVYKRCATKGDGRLEVV